MDTQEVVRLLHTIAYELRTANLIAAEQLKRDYTVPDDIKKRLAYQDSNG